MSQYPSPYQPPAAGPYYASIPPSFNGPAKRASLLMFILGPLILLLGGCLISFPVIMSNAPAQKAEEARKPFEEQFHVSPDKVLPVLGVLIMIPGVVMLVLGFFVRGGRKVPVVLSIIVTGLFLLYFALNLATAFFQPMGEQLAAGLCLTAICVAVFGLLMSWLIKALRLPPDAAAQQQYLAQYWHYQQMMQAYGGAPLPQPGYAPPIAPPTGYAVPPQPYATPQQSPPTPPPTEGT